MPPNSKDLSDSEHLIEVLYGELKELAAARLAGEENARTLQPTALVHEAYLRVAGEAPDEKKWNSKGHFFGAAAQAMRRILVENARKKASQKRGSKPEFTQIGENLADSEAPESDEVLAVHEALKTLEQDNAEAAELVQLRFFGGMTVPEAAAIMGISEAAAKRLWPYAKAKLAVIISEE